jgi:hypothetical protein
MQSNAAHHPRIRAGGGSRSTRCTGLLRLVTELAVTGWGFVAYDSRPLDDESGKIPTWHQVVASKVAGMSSLWTPDGERPVRKPSSPAPTSPSEPPTRSSEEGFSGQPSPEEMQAMESELRAMTEELSQVPAAAVVANHAVGLFQLAAVHLQVVPPNLPDARLAIDAMAAIVDNCKGRLGPDEQTLVDALSQIRLAFVQVSAADRA